MSDALDFFSKYSKLPVPATTKLIDVARCPHCERTQRLYKSGKFIGCRACAPIRMAYKYGKHIARPGRPTLGDADYAFIAPTRSVFYSDLELPNVNTLPPLRGDDLYRMIYDLIRSPPVEPYLFIHFGKPTETRNFVVNETPGNYPSEFIYVSGNVMINKRNARTIKTWLIRKLLRRFPEMTGKDWNNIIGVEHTMRHREFGQKAAMTWNEYNERFPGIFQLVPEFLGVEHRILPVATAPNIGDKA